MRAHRPVERRHILRLLVGSVSAGAWLHPLGTGGALAYGQPGGWLAAVSRPRPTFPGGAVIRTALGDLPPDSVAVGALQFHEHIGGRFVPPRPLGPNDIPPGVAAPTTEAEYLDLMVRELEMSRADGVNGLVDAAFQGRRDARTLENLKTISRRSGMHIIIAGGYYQDLALPAKYPAPIATMAETELVQEFVRDARAQGWGAFGEIASSQPMQPDEQKVIRAIGRAHVQTNLPILTHTPHEGCPACASQQLDLLESAGVDPRRVAVGHLATIKADQEPLGQTARTLGKRGAFLGFDTVGHQMGRSMIPEAHKVRHLLSVLEAGLEDQVLLSADSTPEPQLKTNWGQGFSSVVTQFVPKLRYAGVPDAVLHKILVDNPRRFLAFVPRS
ncbi:MAG: hypothetical protein AB7N65_15730 [Vicinamibacterales bacterium]